MARCLASEPGPGGCRGDPHVTWKHNCGFRKGVTESTEGFLDARHGPCALYAVPHFLSFQGSGAQIEALTSSTGQFLGPTQAS